MNDADRGVELSRRFYRDAVRPIVERRWSPDLYAAALVGAGSEVLGYDDNRSHDHDWGPHLQLFLPPGTSDSELVESTAELDRHLPATFNTHPVRYSLTHDPRVRHHVEVTTSREWFLAQIGFDPFEPIGLGDWIGVPMSRLAQVSAGRVFHDGPGELARALAELQWYPDDLWRWVLACQWRRIAEVEAFPGRCAERGDLLGAGVLVAGIARDIMRLWLMAARVYPPYAKWLGTAFSQLRDVGGVISDLRRAMAASQWCDQERHLGAALVATARRQNGLSLAPECSATLRPYFDRPYLVLDADRFAAALFESITDPAVRALPLTGICDQFMDGVAALTDGELRRVRGI